MPIFEYSCRKCKNKFEELVRGKEKPACPKCESKDLEKLLSLPSMKTETTHGLAMKAARRRDRKQGDQNLRNQAEYEASHDEG